VTRPVLPDGYGGWAATARFLSADAGREIKRQQVYMWHHRRGGNGFPDLHEVVNSRGDRVQAVLLSEALDWMHGYDDRRQRLPGRLRIIQGSTAASPAVPLALHGKTA
jgi:hypothetical protein